MTDALVLDACPVEADQMDHILAWREAAKDKCPARLAVHHVEHLLALTYAGHDRARSAAHVEGQAVGAWCHIDRSRPGCDAVRSRRSHKGQHTGGPRDADRRTHGIDGLGAASQQDGVVAQGR